MADASLSPEDAALLLRLHLQTTDDLDPIFEGLTVKESQDVWRSLRSLKDYNNTPLDRICRGIPNLKRPCQWRSGPTMCGLAAKIEGYGRTRKCEACDVEAKRFGGPSKDQRDAWMAGQGYLKKDENTLFLLNKWRLALDKMPKAQGPAAAPAAVKKRPQSSPQQGRALPEVKKRGKGFVVSTLSSRTVELPDAPAPPKVFGRGPDLAAILSTLDPAQDHHAVVSGPGGVGKTSLALLAFEGARRIDFPRRAFVPCEPLLSAEDILRQLLRLRPEALEAHEDPRKALKAELDSVIGHRTLILLDNIDSPLQADREATIDLLAFLASFKSVSLLLTSRDTGFMSHPSLSSLRRPFYPCELSPLSAAATEELYLSVVPAHAGDPELPTLLVKLDGHPLTILIVASQAAHRKSTPAKLIRAWDRERTAFLQVVRRGGSGTRLSNLALSITISLDALERDSSVSGHAKDLLWLLASLPDGIAVARLCDLGAPAFPSFAWQELVALSLVVRTPTGNLRLLAPVAEFIRTLNDRVPEPSATVRVTLYGSFLETCASSPVIYSDSAVSTSPASDLASLHRIFQAAFAEVKRNPDNALETRIVDALLVGAARSQGRLTRGLDLEPVLALVDRRTPPGQLLHLLSLSKFGFFEPVFITDNVDVDETISAILALEWQSPADTACALMFFGTQLMDPKMLGRAEEILRPLPPSLLQLSCSLSHGIASYSIWPKEATLTFTITGLSLVNQLIRSTGSLTDIQITDTPDFGSEALQTMLFVICIKMHLLLGVSISSACLGLPYKAHLDEMLDLFALWPADLDARHNPGLSPELFMISLFMAADLSEDDSGKTLQCFLDLQSVDFSSLIPDLKGAVHERIGDLAVRLCSTAIGQQHYAAALAHYTAPSFKEPVPSIYLEMWSSSLVNAAPELLAGMPVSPVLQPQAVFLERIRRKVAGPLSGDA